MGRAVTELEQVVKGLTILAKYDNTGGSVDCGHQYLFAGPEGDEVDVAPADCVTLEQLGWHYDEGIHRWGMYL